MGRVNPALQSERYTVFIRFVGNLNFTRIIIKKKKKHSLNIIFMKHKKRVKYIKGGSFGVNRKNVYKLPRILNFEVFFLDSETFY